MVPKPVFIGYIHTKFAKNQDQSHKNPLGRSKNTKNQKNSSLNKFKFEKKWGKKYIYLEKLQS